MKNLLKNKIIFTIIFLIPLGYINAQDLPDMHTPINYNCSDCNLKSATLNNFKVMRVNIHFILKNDGTGNFSETENYYGTTSSENGYWIADLLINEANYYLNNNLEMTQQLSYESIPVEDININYKLNGVFFHRNTTFYECYYQPTSLKRNTDEAFNVFLFTTVNQYGGVQSGKGMWIGDFKKYYDNYVADNNTWQIAHRGKAYNHVVAN